MGLNLIAVVLALRAFVKSYSPRYEILQGEVGCPSQLEFAHALANIEWTGVVLGGASGRLADTRQWGTTVAVASRLPSAADTSPL